MLAREVLQVLDSRSLSREEAASTFGRFVGGDYSEIEMAAVLAALKIRGETPEVMAGAVEALLASARPFPSPETPFADCCGTGGDGSGTVNISTAVAFVLAELGIPVAKTGNRSVSSRCGSADVLEAVGVRLDPTPELSRRCLDEIGVAFLFAPHYHPGVRHAASVRRALGVRTTFNLVGPIANAARPRWQLMGVYDPEMCEPVAQTLRLLGREVALVVHGGGLDEIALHAPTMGALLRDGSVRAVRLSADDAGLPAAPVASLSGGSPEDNGAWLIALLEGKGLPAHVNAVAINAGALALAAGRANTLREGVRAAREALLGGGCAHRLLCLAEMTHA